MVLLEYSTVAQLDSPLDVDWMEKHYMVNQLCLSR